VTAIASPFFRDCAQRGTDGGRVHRRLLILPECVVPGDHVTQRRSEKNIGRIVRAIRHTRKTDQGGYTVRGKRDPAITVAIENAPAACPEGKLLPFPNGLTVL
jgi:hypothetical protein